VFALGCKRSCVMQFSADARQAKCTGIGATNLRRTRRRHPRYVLLPVCQHQNSIPARIVSEGRWKISRNLLCEIFAIILALVLAVG
jgi:hypothetical protein